MTAPRTTLALRILTNMAFWQSTEWVAATSSIYPDHGQCSPTPLPPLQEAWQLFRHRAPYNIIHTMGIRESMGYGLLCLLRGCPSKQIMTEIFVDEPRPASLRWRLKEKIYKRIARRSLGIITNSQAEIHALAERLGLPENRFRYVPLNTTLSPVTFPLPGDGFILAAGRSLRDYTTLLQAAAHIPAPITIIGGSDDLLQANLPPTVTLLREVDRDTYLDYVRRCSIMVLPLLQTTRPTGQVVLLEAMSCGKPVIATRQVGTIDYIDHKKTGLLIPPFDATALATATNHLLQHPQFACELGMHALQHIHHAHTTPIHTHQRLSAIADLHA